MTYPDRPDTKARLWLGLSIAATLLCCTIAGIAGIVYSALAVNAENRGDYHEALEKVGKAKGWTVTAIVIGAIITPLYIYFTLNSDPYSY
jgi:amino acid permease